MGVEGIFLMRTATFMANIGTMEIPEADRLEQQLPVIDGNDGTVVETGADWNEANEADALEQKLLLPGGDEEDYPRAGALDDVAF
jgi:hypothetical protein